MIARLSIPGNLCTHCDTVMTKSIVCPGCGWTDPLTKRPSLKETRVRAFDVV